MKKLVIVLCSTILTLTAWADESSAITPPDSSVISTPMQTNTIEQKSLVIASGTASFDPNGVNTNGVKTIPITVSNVYSSCSQNQHLEMTASLAIAGDNNPTDSNDDNSYTAYHSSLNFLKYAKITEIGQPTISSNIQMVGNQYKTINTIHSYVKVTDGIQGLHYHKSLYQESLVKCGRRHHRHPCHVWVYKHFDFNSDSDTIMPIAVNYTVYCRAN